MAIEQPPFDTDPDLAEYLVRILRTLDNRDLSVFGGLTAIPDKLADGKLYYFSQAVLPDIPSAGFYGRVLGAWTGPL